MRIWEWKNRSLVRSQHEDRPQRTGRNNPIIKAERKKKERKKGEENRKEKKEKESRATFNDMMIKSADQLNTQNAYTRGLHVSQPSILRTFRWCKVVWFSVLRAVTALMEVGPVLLLPFCTFVLSSCLFYNNYRFILCLFLPMCSLFLSRARETWKSLFLYDLIVKDAVIWSAVHRWMTAERVLASDVWPEGLRQVAQGKCLFYASAQNSTSNAFKSYFPISSEFQNSSQNGFLEKVGQNRDSKNEVCYLFANLPPGKIVF